MRYVPELYFKSPDEMRALFPDHPEAISNTLAIAERCNLELEFGDSKYPEYPAPEGKTREAYLRELCYKGLHERYGERAGTDSELIKRLDYEVDVLEKTGFVSYFLIVWDFIHFAKEQRHSGRARARFGRRIARRLRARDHRYRSAAITVCSSSAS